MAGLQRRMTLGGGQAGHAPSPAPIESIGSLDQRRGGPSAQVNCLLPQGCQLTIRGGEKTFRMLDWVVNKNLSKKNMNGSQNLRWLPKKIESNRKRPTTTVLNRFVRNSENRDGLAILFSVNAHCHNWLASTNVRLKKFHFVDHAW